MKHKIKPRVQSELELSFLAEVKKYDNVLNATKFISRNQHGIMTTGRGLRATRIFTRQTVLGVSLDKILPRPTKYTHLDLFNWDVVSLAAFARNILEGYLSFHYFGIEDISDEEAELRFLILQLHRNIEWFEIRKLNDEDNLEEFEKGIPEQKERIKNHPFLSSLSKFQQGLALKGLEMYKTKQNFEESLLICKDLRRDYRLLSNLVHPLPIAIERIDDEKGRGVGSDADINFSLLRLMVARQYLAATTVGMVDFFHEKFSDKKYSSSIEAIRELMSK
ncbi:hypothetical protein [Aeromonas caviae]|uniref:hypothetical protein n=1 Tax=Aeromonas caviae TaxID=648 RepID=UPI002B49E62C|nr:hypothetical protein [Aeromonas caviae]